MDNDRIPAFQQGQLASLDRRFFAFAIDWLILLIPCALGAQLVPLLGGFLVYFLYVPLFESSRLRATLGKRAMGIQVCDLQGQRISRSSAFVRAFVKLISTAVFFLGHAMALFTQRKQALQDLAANTIVVYGRLEYPAADAWTESFKEAVGSTGIGTTTNLVNELERLQSLRERGALTEDEFQEQKRRVLNKSN